MYDIIQIDAPPFDVQTAPDGPEAVALCDAESFDAVLSDVAMPRMNGRDLARSIAARHPRTHLVLMSGFDFGCENCPSAQPRCQFLPMSFRLSEALSRVGDAVAQLPSN